LGKSDCPTKKIEGGHKVSLFWQNITGHNTVKSLDNKSG